MAPNHRRGPWVPEEDTTLLQLVHEQGPNNWVRISQQMHFRSPKQCRERFHQNLKPTLNHTPISADEGLMIERMVNDMGKRWAEIARRLGNRSDNAVKNWWNGNMNRKRRGLVVQTGSQHSSRTFNGRIEHPYPRDHHHHHHIRRPSTAKSTVSYYHERLSSPELEQEEEDEENNTRHLAPILTNTRTRTIEPAITSPSYSEISTLEPPSMVSDHNSVSSASPRTLPSPIPLDARQVYYQNQQLPQPQRRGSAPTYSFLHHPNSSREDVYLSSHQHHTTEKERHWSVDHGYSTSESPYQHHQHTIPSAPRDSRMGLQSLLN